MENEKELFYVTLANKNAKVKFVFDAKGKLIKKDDLQAMLSPSLVGSF